MAPDADADAALELSILGVDLPTSKSKSPTWWKPNVHYALAWLDPLAKQSTGAITPHRRRKLYFPLSSSVLDSPHSLALSIDLLSPSRLPFHSSGKLLGTAVLPLSAVRLSPETFALPLLRPSGKPAGSIRVAARVLWDLGFRREEADWQLDAAVAAGCPSAPSIDLTADAPEWSGSEIVETAESMWSSEDPKERELGSSAEGERQSVECDCRDTGGGEEMIENGRTEKGGGGGGDGGGDMGRVAMGLIGAIAAIAIGVACHRMKVRPFSISVL